MILYRLLSIFIQPFLPLYLRLRINKGKEDAARASEKLAKPSLARPQGDLIWLHAVSVGELNSALILLDEILKADSKANILVTTTTITSASLLANKLNAYQGRVIHQFLPFDSYFIVKKFLNYWQPKTMILLESEIWPNLISQSKKRGIKTVLVNARMSPKSFEKWQFAQKIGFHIFNQFDLIFSQTALDQQRLTTLSQQEVLFLGNLKSQAANLECDQEKLQQLQQQIKNRKLWLAASTHKGEEEIIISAHKKLKEKFPDILTILVPRHPVRGDEIIALMPDLTFSQRSQNQAITDKTELYFADSLGELGIFYRLCDIAFIGGSIADVGGHNPFEAIKLNCAVISGRNSFNFKEIYALLEEKMAYFLVQNESDLVNMVAELLTNDKLKEDTIINALQVIKQEESTCPRIVEKILT